MASRRACARVLLVEGSESLPGCLSAEEVSTVSQEHEQGAAGGHDGGQGGGHPPHQYFVDSVKYEWPTSGITGAQIRASLPSATRSFKIFKEGRGGEADKEVSDGDSFNLDPQGQGVLQFYTVPPATFGNE